MSIQLRTIVAATPSAHLMGNGAVTITKVAYDSRHVEAGTLFVAIRGFHVDGHNFIAQAVANGAAAIVVDARHWSGEAPRNVPLVTVPNSRAALAPIAATFYGEPGRELSMIGITGTKGKSTTTDLVAQVMEAGGSSSGMISTVDFKIGARRWANSTRQSTPEALEIQAMLREMADAGCAYAVLEATSHALSTRWNRLGRCFFDTAIMLNITHEHLDYHGTFEQYRADKAELFGMLGEGHSDETKWAIVNADDPNHRFFLDAAPPTAHRLTFGLTPSADVQATPLQITPSGSLLHIVTPWGSGDLQLQLPGRFNIANALAALSAALSHGITFEQAAAVLSQIRGVRGRMESIHEGQPFEVIVDYAHNPDSFEQVMGMLRPLVSGRMIAVFGSAGERDQAKRAMQGAIAAKYCELLVLTDEDPRAEDRLAIINQIAEGAESAGKHRDRDYLVIPDRAKAIHVAMISAQPGDVVLLLGKGHEGNIIYADHSLPWNEAEEARKALRALNYRPSKV